MASHNQKNRDSEPEAYYHLTLYEVTRSFGVSVETIIEIIDEGIIRVPTEKKQEKWIFDAEALNRIRTVIHLNKDLGINYPGAALILDLLEEIESLRREH